MRRQDFLNNFGGYYLMLEKKLMTTFNYVGLSTSNFSTFSNEYALLIQSIRSVYKELHADHETGAADNK